MVSHLKELSEDEKIRQQCAARDDYERRLIGEYNRGERDGRESGIEIGLKTGRLEGKLEATRNLVDSLNITVTQAMDILKIPEGERESIVKML